MNNQSTIQNAYNHKLVAYEVGQEKDNYSVTTHYTHNIESDAISYTAEVVKNWSYNEIPASGAVEGKKYREVLTKGTLHQCYDFIDYIVKARGYWKKGDKPFTEIFIKPVDNIWKDEEFAHEFAEAINYDANNIEAFLFDEECGDR